MSELREVFEMTTKQVEPEVDAWRQQEGRQRRTARNRKFGALAAAAVIVIVAAVAIVRNLDAGAGKQGTTPAGVPTTVTTVDPAAVGVAMGFVEAFGDFDGERAITYLADNPDLQMDATTPAELPVLTSYLEATGYEQLPVDGCSATGSSASGTTVRCRFDWHGIRSDEIGLGPYTGRWDLTVRDGEIVSVALTWNTDRFSTQMWEPFADWVSKNHPKDFDVMYVGFGSNFRLTEESIQLWEKRTKEYVEAVKEGTA